jgi:hypothetical protein
MSVVWLLIGPFFMYHGFRTEPICYRNVKVPLPNQKFWRASFIVLVLALIVGGLWNPWLGGTGR